MWETLDFQDNGTNAKKVPVKSSTYRWKVSKKTLDSVRFSPKTPLKLPLGVLNSGSGPLPPNQAYPKFHPKFPSNLPPTYELLTKPPPRPLIEPRSDLNLKLIAG